MPTGTNQSARQGQQQQQPNQGGQPQGGQPAPGQQPQQGQTQQPPAGSETPPAPQNWDEILATLPEGQQELYNQHVHGLRNALESERSQRSDLARQLREATSQLEEGSEARQSLEELSGQLEVAEQRTAFYEDALRPEVGCRNPRLAFVAAQEIGAFDRRGNPNWDQIKKAFPELFAQPRQSAPPAGAGAGTNTQPTSPFDMNQAIREAAGRNSL